MQTQDRDAGMDQMDTLDVGAWEFVCSGERLPNGRYQAVVRYKAPPDGRIRTLTLDPVEHGSPGEALEHAKVLATRWAQARDGDGRGQA